MITFYDSKKHRCPICGSYDTKHFGTLKLKSKKHIKQRFKCNTCGITWTIKNKTGTGKLKKQITKESLERGSVRILGRRFKKDKMTILKIIHEETQKAKDSRWIAKKFQPHWSGILVIDGKYVKVYDKLSTKIMNSRVRNKKKLSDEKLKSMNRSVWLCGIDSGTGDLPYYALAEEESKIELVMYFKQLKENGYKLRVLVCDGNEDFISAASHVYGETFLIQRCTRHFIEGLKRKAKEFGVSESSSINDLIATIQAVIESRSLNQALEVMKILKSKKYKGHAQRYLLDDFKKHADQLTTHLQFPELKIPHTNNEIENLFKQLNLRLKTIGRFGHWIYAENYLKSWALMRRFTPFTDCRGKKRKHRNKRRPLELAGCDLSNLDYLDLK